MANRMRGRKFDMPGAHLQQCGDGNSFVVLSMCLVDRISTGQKNMLKMDTAAESEQRQDFVEKEGDIAAEMPLVTGTDEKDIARHQFGDDVRARRLYQSANQLDPR